MDLKVCILKKETADMIAAYLVKRPFEEVSEILANIHLDTTNITVDMLKPVEETSPKEPTDA